MPLVEKCVTVNGSAIAKPQNVIAPIGTSIADLVEFCGGFKSEPKKILLGGPMMGISIPNVNTCITKQTNAVLAFDQKDARASAESACIRCGKCISHCPFGLSPCDIARAYDKGDAATLEKLKVNICMECGCCSYICPAKRNIVQKNKLAKAMLRNYKMGGAK
jgi:electron transport complex protein RnfC